MICQIRVGVNSNFDASELAKKFNGGGHAKAASFKINEADMSFQQVVDAVKKEVGFVTSETL